MHQLHGKTTLPAQKRGVFPRATSNELFKTFTGADLVCGTPPKLPIWRCRACSHEWPCFFESVVSQILDVLVISQR